MQYNRFWVLIAFLGWAGCSAPAPIQSPVQGNVTLAGNVVIWETSSPTLGAVRYGRSPGQYDFVAYPNAAFEGDRALSTEHRIPLLSVRVGEVIYLQVLNLTESHVLTSDREVSFTVTERPSPRPLMQWTMIDVGFGDSHLLTMPTTGVRVLIDGGERRDGPTVVAYLKGAVVTILDGVMGTHIHADHIGGLIGDSFTLEDGVLGAYPVGLFLDSPVKSASRFAYDELLDTLELRDVARTVINPGETDQTNSGLAWDPAVTVQALNSGGGRSIGGSGEGDWLNNDSILLRLTYGKVSFVLGGDSEAPVERRLVANEGVRLESEVLKIHHHGLDDTSEPEWLDAVSPRVGLIPITTYESFSGTLPSGNVLTRMRARNIDIYASDRAEPLGIQLTGNRGHNVTVFTDGESYELLVVPSVSDHYPPD